MDAAGVQGDVAVGRSRDRATGSKRTSVAYSHVAAASLTDPRYRQCQRRQRCRVGQRDVATTGVGGVETAQRVRHGKRCAANTGGGQCPRVDAARGLIDRSTCRQCQRASGGVHISPQCNGASTGSQHRIGT